MIPIPGMSMAPKRNGPIKTPENKYAVTAGSFNFLASLDNKSPAKSAIDKLNKIVAVCDKKIRLLSNSSKVQPYGMIVFCSFFVNNFFVNNH